MTMQRIGRTTHPTLGSAVKIMISIWEGPTAPHEHGRHREQTFVLPIDQSQHAMHPRHPTGYDVDTLARASFSPSLSFYGDLCRYAQFRWRSLSEGAAA